MVLNEDIMHEIDFALGLINSLMYSVNIGLSINLLVHDKCHHVHLMVLCLPELIDKSTTLAVIVQT